MARRDGLLWLDALEDLEIMAEIIGQVALDRRPEVLDDAETRWRLLSAVERSQARERAQGRPAGDQCPSAWGQASQPHAPAVLTPVGLATPVPVASSLVDTRHRRYAMRVRVLLQITGDDGSAGAAEAVATFEKATERPEDLSMSIAEGKELLAAIQHRTVTAQVAEWSKRHRCCQTCGERRRVKGSYQTSFRTLYGDVELSSPRLHRCRCQGMDSPGTVSPLRDLLPHHVPPERLYLQARWASLVPYAAAAGLLADILPITSGADATTLREHVLRVAERAEAELGEERPCFFDGCPAEWQELPIPAGDRKSNFEVIVGRSLPEDRDARYIGLVHGYDRKPKRRLFDLLKSQGLQANQDVTFLTDGGEEVRALTKLVTPASEHVLDWFHITMRLTVLGQYARGVGHYDDDEGARLLRFLDRIKWLLWPATSTETIGFFEDDVSAQEVGYPSLGKICSGRA
jgi:hypothetical protein